MRFFPPPEKLMKMARERAGRADGFFRFRAVWPELLARVAENAALRERMRRKMGA
jgi:hypothetical protein